MAVNLLKITADDMTPLVTALLEKLQQSDELIEELQANARAQREVIQQLRDEIARLKNSSKRPQLKPNKKERQKKAVTADKRPGSSKVSKKPTVEIHETIVVAPEGLPEGSKLRRRRQFDIQDLILRAHNTRYILEDWEAPDGTMYAAQVPSGNAHGHFGSDLCAYILNQHHQCQVTQPLLHEQLAEFGIDISTGQLNAILTEGKDLFHQEKDEILKVGLSVSSYIQTDDTGARHNGKNGYCTHIGNRFFAWFQSSSSKSRINFLSLLNSAYGGAYQLNQEALCYMEREKLPKRPLEILQSAIKKQFATPEAWTKWLKESRIIKQRHIRIATEGALFGGAIAGGLNPSLVILSDDAGQFNVPMLKHALCWIHEERHLKNLIPGNNEAKAKDLEAVLADFWSLYGKLKQYKQEPSSALASTLTQVFDELFKRKTSFELLNMALKHAYAKKEELLVVLKEPALPLHNNESESDIREFVKRRKVSGGTRSTSGQKCRDTFASLKKTCRKLGVSFFQFLKDRLAGKNEIDSLGSLITKAATKHIGHSQLDHNGDICTAVA